MKEVTRLRGYTDQMVEDANSLILTFGSYRLGVNGFIYLFGPLPLDNLSILLLDKLTNNNKVSRLSLWTTSITWFYG